MNEYDKHRPKLQLSKAIPISLYASFFNAVMAFFVKWKGGEIPVDVMVFYRYLVSSVIIIGILFWMHPKGSILEKIKTKRLGLQVVRAITSVLSLYCYFYAVKELSLQLATLLAFTAPIFVPLISRVWTKTPIYRGTVISILIGFIGVGCVVDPSGSIREKMIPMLFALVGAVIQAISYLATRLLAYTEPPERSVFYLFVGSTALSGMTAGALHPHELFLMNLDLAWIYAVVGICGFIWIYLIVKAANYAPARLTSSLVYSSVVFAGMFDWIFWGVPPGPLFLMGFLLVVLGTSLLTYFVSKTEAQIGK